MLVNAYVLLQAGVFWAALAGVMVSAPHPLAESLAPPVAAAVPLEDAYASFGFDMLRRLRISASNDNVFISPTSLAVALSMAASGARGSTQAAMMKTLGVSDRPIETLNAQNAALIGGLRMERTAYLKLADAVWLRKSTPVRPEYQQLLKTFYGAEVENIDFSSDTATKAINDWASRNTNGRVKRIVDRVEPSTTLMLTNAIAFKANWKDPFQVATTRQETFTDAAGAMQTVSMMQHVGSYAYAKTGDVEAVRLPYAGGQYAMYVVLPADGSSMDAFTQNLREDTFTALRASLVSQDGELQLPRFTIDYGASMNDALEHLGMGVAFGHSADFSGICASTPSLEIDEVRHASFLEVDERGTEAAAVTSIHFVQSAADTPPRSEFHMIVNRPFFVAIRNEDSGLLLFVGTIANPQG